MFDYATTDVVRFASAPLAAQLKEMADLLDPAGSSEQFDLPAEVLVG